MCAFFVSITLRGRDLIFLAWCFLCMFTLSVDRISVQERELNYCYGEVVVWGFLLISYLYSYCPSFCLTISFHLFFHSFTIAFYFFVHISSFHLCIPRKEVQCPGKETGIIRFWLPSSTRSRDKKTLLLSSLNFSDGNRS